MITNGIITIYHKELDKTARLERWIKTMYKAWYFGGKGSGINKGYENANDISVRIPYDENELEIGNFSIGDIIYIGEGQDITKQTDLEESYNITSITNNEYGNNPHIHLGGK